MPKGIKYGGRKKGTPNKVSRTLKEQIIEAANLAGGEDGVIGYLTKQAMINPGPFMALLGKVLPLQLTGENGGPIKTEEVSARDKLADRIFGVIARTRDEETSGKPH